MKRKTVIKILGTRKTMDCF